MQHSQHDILDSARSSVSRVVQVTGAESRCPEESLMDLRRKSRLITKGDPVDLISHPNPSIQCARGAYLFKNSTRILFFTTSTPFCWNVKFPWPRHPLAWCPEILAPSHVEVRVGHKEKKGDVGPMVGCSAASSLHHRSSCAHLNCECVYIYICIYI